MRLLANAAQATELLHGSSAPPASQAAIVIVSKERISGLWACGRAQCCWLAMRLPNMPHHAFMKVAPHHLDGVAFRPLRVSGRNLDSFELYKAMLVLTRVLRWLGCGSRAVAQFWVSFNAMTTSHGSMEPPGLRRFMHAYGMLMTNVRLRDACGALRVLREHFDVIGPNM
jgi:hypothetical protein